MVLDPAMPPELQALVDDMMRRGAALRDRETKIRSTEAHLTALSKRVRTERTKLDNDRTELELAGKRQDEKRRAAEELTLVEQRTSRERDQIQLKTRQEQER
ncbi:hypothetical protein FALCPG4_018407 [Fusarium falciforme]